MASIFTVDWEVWNSFESHTKWNPYQDIDEPTHYLLDLLRRHQIKAVFFCVGWLKEKRSDLAEKIKSDGHVIGNHTYLHSTETGSTLSTDKSDSWRGEGPRRAPRWKGEKRLFSGGFWFRAMPYWWTKREVEKTNVFFVHPHDVLLEHPECGLRTFDRRLGLKTSRDKLERLCREVEWENPQDYLT